jgi:flagellar hook-length control protein FliK
LPGQGDAASGAGDASKTAAAVAAAGHDAGNATAGAAVRAATAAAQLQALVASTPADARGTAAAAAGTADDADGQADTQAGSVAAAPAGTAAPTLAQTVANLLKMFDGGGTSPSKSADASATDPAAAASTAAAANAPAAAGTQAAAGGNLHALFTSLLHAAGTASAALHGAAGDAGAASVGAGGDPTAQQAPAAGPAAPQNLAAFLNLSGSAATRGADAGAATLQSLAQPIAMHDAGWQDALSGRVHMLLQTADDGSSNEARIQLHPRDLGSIQVHVRMGSDGADVRFAATHPDVRHQLESSLPRLRELLASGGLALAQAHVGSQFSQHSQQSQQGAATASRRGAAAVNDAGGVEMDGIRPVRIASVSLIDDYA